MLRWFARRLSDAQKEEKGFTLIELLVVIIIIAILAAIAIPTFLAQRERAWEASAQSDLRNLATAMTSYSSTNNGSFAGVTELALQQQGWNRTDAVDVTVTLQNGGTCYNSFAGHTAGGRRMAFTTCAAAFEGVNPGQVGVSNVANNAAVPGALTIN